MTSSSLEAGGAGGRWARRDRFAGPVRAGRPAV